MKTRSKKLHCDNLQKRNDFSKSASLHVPQLSSPGVCQCGFIPQRAGNSEAAHRADRDWSRERDVNCLDIICKRRISHANTGNEIFTSSSLNSCSSPVFKILIRCVTFKITENIETALNVHKKSVAVKNGLLI